MYEDKTFSVSIPGEEASVNKKLTSPSLYRRWNRFSTLQRLLLTVITLVLLFIVVFLIPTLKHDLFDLNQLTDEDKLNLPIIRPQPAIVDLKPKDGNLNQEGTKRPKRGPPVLSPDRRFGIDSPQIPNPIQNQSGTDQINNNKPLSFNGPINSRQTAVVGAFNHAWTAYKKYAWGKDELRPVSRSHSEWFKCGLTLLDSLDTMYIMGFMEEFYEALNWVKDSNLVVSKDVNLFEFTIRVVGGLLSAYHLSKDEMFLTKAVELGDHLLPAFKSPSGIPYSDINPKTGKAHGPHWGSDSSLSEVTTIQLEFNDLSFITKDPKYRDASSKVTRKIHDLPKKHQALVSMYINPRSGEFRSGGMLTLGARVDSYYEYLLKQWIQTGKTDDVLKQDYLDAIDAIKKNLVRESEPNKLTFVGEIDVTSGRFYAKMDHLVCFLPGTLALGYKHGLDESHLLLARKLMFTCYQTYATTATGLAPEISHFNTIPGVREDIYIKPADTHNLLRPETVESLFYLYSITKEKQYQEWGWKIFLAFQNHTKLNEGYSSINNVKNPESVGFRDKMESFFLGETLKYFYLLFQDPSREDGEIWPQLDKWIFNTEAHLVPLRKSGDIEKS